MSPIASAFSTRSRCFAAHLCLIYAVLCVHPASIAAASLDLYQATVLTADQSEEGRDSALRVALKVVLVRVTGRRGADQDPAFAPLLDNTRRYVQQYRAGTDNQLNVTFDGPAIERWLAQNAQPLWGRERPTTFVWLAVQSPPPGLVMTADDKSALKGLIEEAAETRGIRLRWPSVAEVQNNHLDYAGVGNLSPSVLADIGHRLGGEGVLVGRASNLSSGSTVRWSHLFQDHSGEYFGVLEGVNRAADTYAGIFAASGNQVPVDVEISGINDVRAYANLQAYLESLTFISRVNVQALNGDTVRFRLTSRGGAESLQHALALGGRLQSVAAGDDGIPRYQLRR